MSPANMESTSLPRLNTQPVPPTPMTGDQQITSAPANQTIFDELPNVTSPIPTREHTSDSSAFQYDDGGRHSPFLSGSPSPSPRSVLLSPSKTSPTSRPLSPDLPTRDALYLFSNFSSYMRSPNEGSEGLRADDFKDTIRLLEHARWLTSQPHSSVHILHLKYRFQGQSTTFRSPYSTGDYQLPLNYKDSTGRVRNPVPQPFSVLHDPVVKIDYMENGVFDPLPAQAVFSHIAKMCQPPPRVLVISYVYSKVIENHLSSLSAWALTSSPPAYIFSPVETRLRESQPLHDALGHSIPMSMYAWPNEVYQTPSSSLSPVHTPLYSNSASTSSHRSVRVPSFGVNPFSPISPNGQHKVALPPISLPGKGTKKAQRRRKIPLQDNNNTIEGKKEGQGEDVNSPILITRRISGTESPNDIVDRYYAGRTSQVAAAASTNGGPTGVGGRKYKDDPIASLTVISSSPPTADETSTTLERKKSNESSKSHISPTSGHGLSPGTVPPPIDRIPLWHLAPGVGILHGSTSSSIGIKLSDFSAINLVGDSGNAGMNGDGISNGDILKKEVRKSEVEELGIKTEQISNLNYHDLLKDNHSHTSLHISHTHDTLSTGTGTDAGGITISRPSSTTPLPQPIGIPKPPFDQVSTRQKTHDHAHLTPPNHHPRPVLPNRDVSMGQRINSNSNPSWPAPVSRVPDWRKGRKELMEDTLEEMGLGEEYDMDQGRDREIRMEDVVENLEGLVSNQNSEHDQNQVLDMDMDATELGVRKEAGEYIELIDLLGS
ncbi:hypothetical protein L486_01596 [Kwoniella mangroviensis CBS 10435]|uniref:Uncharacterized protein n=1 Tax=Kwoniella mangroviensis CBS 10435 TaxID=1331196 RepID=A0A1B9J2B8_9TREE|nr:hypothetical protein L486_01596 [Kwoniella mangroviensis CBS 10435]